MVFSNLQTLLNSQKVIPHFAVKKNLLHPYPTAVEFHWCSSCNYNCIHCSYGERRKTSARLSDQVIQQTIDDLARLGTKAVYLSGGGEPTTLRNWDIHAQNILDKDMEVALVTNSAAIHDKHFDLLKKFNYIAVSVYSTNQDHYEKIVGSKHFDKQFRLAKIIKENSQTIVGARCVINSINYREIFDTYQRVIQEGFDYIIFIPAIDYERRKIDLTDQEKQEVLHQIDENLHKINPNNTNLLKVKENGVGHYGNEYLSKLSDCTQCASIKIGTNAFINYDGEVYLCQPLIGQKEYSIGNLNENNFASIWNAQQHKQVINNLHKRFSQGACENCRAISYNIAIDQYLINTNKNLTICPKDNFL